MGETRENSLRYGSDLCRGNVASLVVTAGAARAVVQQALRYFPPNQRLWRSRLRGPWPVLPGWWNNFGYIQTSEPAEEWGRSGSGKISAFVLHRIWWAPTGVEPLFWSKVQVSGTENTMEDHKERKGTMAIWKNHNYDLLMCCYFSFLLNLLVDNLHEEFPCNF